MQNLLKLSVIAVLLAAAPAHAAHHRHRGHGVPWCGLWMESHTGIHGPGNLARAIEWRHVGQPASGPAPGIIGVMAHHVFQVIAVLGGGKVLAISGNDGGAVRTRPRQISGRDRMEGVRLALAPMVRPRYRRRRDVRTRMLVMAVRLTDKELETLDAAAAARGLHKSGLAAQLIENIVTDNLFSAVLDG